jgi:hypothetical protein
LEALTCAGVCLNQAESGLCFSKKTMMGQADTTHTLSEVSRMGEGRSPCCLLAGGGVLLRSWPISNKGLTILLLF